MADNRSEISRSEISESVNQALKELSDLHHGSDTGLTAETPMIDASRFLHSDKMGYAHLILSPEQQLAKEKAEALIKAGTFPKIEWCED